MTTIADFLVMQLLVLVTLFVVYMVRDRLAMRQARHQQEASHEPPRPRVRAISVSAASA